MKEKIYRQLFALLAFASVLFLVGISITLFVEGLPVFMEVGVFDFLFGKLWYPTSDPPDFGILPLIMATVWVTGGALVIGIVLGVGSAIYIHEMAGRTQRAILKPTVEILAAIPSIVYGFFGMVLVAPFLQRLLDIPVGLCAFTGSLVLGIMTVPTICSISEDALSYVPHSFREASLAVGANRWQTLTQVVIPAAGSGISTAIILGMSRAVGETMTVLMVCGGAAMVPTSFFQPVRPMTAAIAAEMGEAVVGGLHFHALFAIGLILFFITLLFNVVAEMVSRRFRLKLGLAG
ncbi:MAG: phosphate ABC transporter permease subunit PstC [Deltaproteobacteria bacterium]|nr:phosphate ABC transporter permease subunit PstC [Deltaproteobacteria bacterium]